MSSFPYKLHQLLTDIEKNEELSSIISWLPSGNGFRIHQPVVFETVLLKKYFPRQSKLKSFKRQVQYYGFENLGRGSYSHQCFVRGRRSLCGKIIHKLPMKNIKKTPKTSAATAIATIAPAPGNPVVSRSPSPAHVMGMMALKSASNASPNLSPMPVFSNHHHGKLPMLDSQAFAMSPSVMMASNKSSELVVPKGQNFARPAGLSSMYAQSAAAAAAVGPNSLAYLNQKHAAAAFGGMSNPTLNFQQHQAMQEYLMKLLLSR